MKRTRKWAFVAQEAKRLAELGLTPPEIAERLGVKRSSVNRWMAAGKLTDTRRGAGTRAPRTVHVTKLVKPSEWAFAVRRDFALDATDEQLVTLAETALGKALDPQLPPVVQLQAMRTFQGLVKQLALIARLADRPGAGKDTSDGPAVPPRVVHRPAGDPRVLLMAVK